MKTEYRIFLGVAAFLFVMAIVYWFWSGAALSRYDWIGTTTLTLSGLLCLMCGGYFWFVSRRLEPRPEDRRDAEIAEGAGEIGFFSPGSYWPFAIAVAATLASLGLVFWMWWLIALGVLGAIVTAAAMLFEYYTGTRRTAEH
ncbi:cytochrome c oxidase subunit 4 [Catellatospora bangladeshensis]|uniref:Cytochrome c oxidase polypeptide 4 n=1 Tax=Catellatospora bangladeshensis TaxID=310355 RepID=A0A8J3JY52_9ACTN|nr:cytochrome c oxidase subunit 4 [Catellatospora bangladeshensis]GIF85209.1 cytochrome c oxidase polypeptide 4 [Catellatospora bangladeshensis]